MATAATDPYTAAYYTDQRHKIADSYSIGLTDSLQKKQQADLSWSDRLQQLGQQLGIQRQQFGDRFAQRGLLDSGIYNYGSGSRQSGGLGALQQFTTDAGRQMSTAQDMSADVDNQYNTQRAQLGSTRDDQLNTLDGLETADQARQNIASSISGAVA